MRFHCKTDNIKSITTIFAVVVMLVLFSTACGDKEEVVEVAFDPEKTYTAKITDVVNLVSDSGVVKYKFIAEEWYVYEKSAEPYYYFPKGVYAEKYDSLFNVEGSFKADTGYNYIKKQLWEFKKNVKVVNLKGEKFDTDHLFWDEKEGKIYSDEYIRIETGAKIITGIGFESNQDMSKYQVYNSQGVFPVKENAADTTVMAADSVSITPAN